MENSKKWSVTYTKHIKQKRKVYQDGFLNLHISTNMVKLFDDCDKLLECRILNCEEVVRSGEMLAFNGYLVDVGDPEGEVDQKPISGSNLHGRDRPRSALMHRYKFRSPISSGDKKDSADAEVKHLSSSRKIIREFKKSELQKYGGLRSCPEFLEILNPGVKEWQVLYTTQMSQKAKKYHDGFLRLTNSGSLGRQIMLYDESRRLLDSRFLKKNETIRSHESVVFDAHLVDIGEPENQNQLPVDLDVQGNKINFVDKEQIMHEDQNCLAINKSSEKEWCALYTSQITQKVKKYHKGILTLASYGSYRIQATLVDEDKTILSSMFLSLSEDVREGSTFVMPKYLVEVGEPYIPKETSNGACPRKDAGSKFNISSIETAKFQNNACLEEDAASNIIYAMDRTKKCNSAPTNKSLRDIHQILSIVQKPLAEKSVVVGCTDKSIIAPVSCAKGHQVLDAEVDHSRDSQFAKASLNGGPRVNKGTVRSSEVTDIDKYTDLLTSEEISNAIGGQLSSDCETGNTNQSNLDDTKADMNWCDEVFASGFSNSANACAPHGPLDDTKKSNELLKSATEINECPNFDLGF